MTIEVSNLTAAADSPRQVWETHARGCVPAYSEIRGRNAAITATYARLYLSHPTLFKRMGVSAFSSHRVGVLLKLYDTTRPQGRLARAIAAAARVSPWTPASAQASVRACLDLMRSANNAVYDETAWAHFAYGKSTDHGLEVLEEALSRDTRHALMLDGFREIDRGRRLLADPARAAEGEAAIWHGNLLLMRHEQEVVIQPYFEQLDRHMTRFMSLLTWMDFDLETLLPLPRRLNWQRMRRFIAGTLRRADYRLDYTWFQGCLWLRGRHVLHATRSRPNVRLLEHRWYWIAHHVMPLWREVEKRDPTLPEKMLQILAGPMIA